jgi:hypothetical protein
MASREAAVRAVQLFRIMLGRGYLGADPETRFAVEDLEGFVMAGEENLFRKTLDDVSRRVTAALADAGLEVHGELRGVLQNPGRPDTAVGFKAAVGDGLPPGWPDPTALLDRVRELEAEVAELRAQMSAVADRMIARADRVSEDIDRPTRRAEKPAA